MNNDDLFNDAKDAIEKLFSDTSVSQSTTKGSLEELIEEIEGMIESLEVDKD